MRFLACSLGFLRILGRSGWCPRQGSKNHNYLFFY